jgi:hypothetical protein
MLKIKLKENDSFLLIIVLASLVFGIMLPSIKGHSIHFRATVVVILTSASIYLFFPKLFNRCRALWILMGERIGRMNSFILYSFIYIFLFSLVRLCFALLRRDKLLKNWKKYNSTYKEKSAISLFEDPF